MNSTGVLSASGVIKKKELVKNHVYKFLSDYLVLESLNPFPAIKFKSKKKLPHYYYIALKEDYLEHDLKIAIRKIERKYKEEITSAIGYLEVKGENYTVIRLKNIKRSMLKSVFQHYLDEGIKIATKKESFQEKAVVEIKKFFYLEKVSDSIYSDLDEEAIGYFEIPAQISWETFVQLTWEIKNRDDALIFDAALGAIQKNSVTHHMIRIYYPNLNQEILKDISNEYLKRLK